MCRALCTRVLILKARACCNVNEMLQLQNAKSQCMAWHGIASRYTRKFIVKILSDVHLKRSLRLSDWIIRTLHLHLHLHLHLYIDNGERSFVFSLCSQCVCVCSYIYVLCMSFFYSQRISGSCSDNFVNATI